jgi:uncharacterized repeat protein (TIGR03847 family)
VSDAFDLGDLDYLAVGATGPSGERVFLLQAAHGRELITLKVEKQQVDVLARYFTGLIEDLEKELGPPHDIPTPPEIADLVEVDFVVGAMEVSYDAERDRLVLVAEEVGDEDAAHSTARLTITRAQAAAFAIEGRRLIKAGRPACPFCGYPLDARGHVCPKMNGHRPPLR